jgi:hypothetical protein
LEEISYSDQNRYFHVELKGIDHNNKLELRTTGYEEGGRIKWEINREKIRFEGREKVKEEDVGGL